MSKRKCPAVQYAMLSTEDFKLKHLLGVIDENETIPGRENADRNASANYACCDELERRGWVKQGHNHDLTKDGVTIRLRSLPVTSTGDAIDPSFVDLDAIDAVVSRCVTLADKAVVWKCKTCGVPVDREFESCQNCWEVERRLTEYLRSEAGQAKVRQALLERQRDARGDA